ncbi:MAG: hypothetical protein HOY79_01840 [Streptomyces sp.]|nr:hypothetical protein [Streptomyces sp.]
MTAAIGIAYALTVAVLAAAIWRVIRRMPDRVEADSRYIAPNDPRLPAGLDKRLDDYAALDPDLAEHFWPGLGELRQAIRDEQQKGDQA